MITVAEPNVAEHVLTSDGFSAYPMAEQYRALGKRTGFNFDGIIRLINSLPIFIDAEAHRRNRKSMARGLAASRNMQEAAASEKIAALFSRLFVRPNEFDLLSEFAQPLWRAISAAIVPADDATLELVEQIPSLFSPALSLRERQRINDSLVKFIGAEANDDDRLSKLCLAALGARPFVGSLALSVYRIVMDNAGKKSNDIVWPETYPESAVKYLDRLCRRPAQIEGHDFASGSRVRCYIHDTNYSDADNKALLFGLGVHTCLGKGISEFSWRELVRRLTQLDAFLAPLGMQMDLYAEPFAMPSTARIAVR